MAETTIKSLDRIDNNGVMRVWETFAEKKQRFTSIGSEIRNVHYAIKHAWDGQAYGEYVDQFDNIFYQVDDIGDALTEIADALKEVIYDSFYVADDSLNQQLLEAQHNTRKGSSDDSGGTADYKQLQPKPVLYSTIKAAYMPNLAYRQLPARPILVSTIAQAYKPNLAYHAMSPKPVLSSCLPSAKMIDIFYRNLPQRAVLSSVIGDALQADVGYAELALRAQLSSTIGDMLIPDLSYVPLSYRSMDAATLSNMLQFLLDYSAAPPNLREVKNTLMATQINQIVIQSLAAGSTDAETASKIGEAVLSNIHGELNPQMRETLVKVIGNSVFESMYGRAPGSEGSGGSINWIDTAGEKANLGMVRDVVGMMAKPVPNAFSQAVTGVKQASDTACLLNLKTCAGAPKSTETIIAPREPIGAASAQKVATAMGQLATEQNCRTVEACICRAAAEKAGGSSLFQIGAVNQTISGNTIVINTGTPSVTPDTLGSIVAGDMSASAQTNISNIVNQWSSQAGQFDFSALKFPVTSNAFSIAS